MTTRAAPEACKGTPSCACGMHDAVSAAGGRTAVGVDPAIKARNLTRLRRIEGQVRGLQRMVEERRECEEVLTQLMAIRSGLEQVSLLLLDNHVRDCLLGGTNVSDDTLRALQQTLRIWARYGAPASQLPE